MSTTEYDPAARKAAGKAVTYYTADHTEIKVGSILWDNNLDAVRVTEIAAQVYGMPCEHTDFVYHTSGCETAWHDVEYCKPGKGRSSYDAGPYGRLAARFDGVSAEFAVRRGLYSIADVRAWQHDWPGERV